MRLSNIIASIENAVLRTAPKAKAAVVKFVETTIANAKDLHDEAEVRRLVRQYEKDLRTAPERMQRKAKILDEVTRRIRDMKSC